MKEVLTSKKAISIIALLLSIVMLFSACGGDQNSSSESSTTAALNSEKDVSDNNASGDASDGASNVAGTSSVGQTNNSGGSGNASNVGSGSTTFAADPWSNIPAAVKKKEVHVLMWRKYTKTEQSLVDGFEKKTGMKVRTTVTTEKEYSTKLISLISGKDSPDVTVLGSNTFPGVATKALQVLDNEKFKLNDSAWYKDYMNYFKVNGKYFSVAMRGSWSCEDCNYVTFYNPALLKSCGVTTMPYDLYKQGKWNWDTQKEIATKVAKAKSSYIGISIQSSDIFMISAGTDFVKYNGSSFTNSLGSVGTSSLITKAWQQMAELRANKVSGGWNADDFEEGNVGLFTEIAYGLYKDGKHFDDMTGGYASIQAVPVAGPKGGTTYIPVGPKTWGVAKGAKNPEGAAYFLRWFLDSSKCNMSSTFYNSQFQTVFNTITAKGAKKCPFIAAGVVNYVTSGTYERICSAIENATSANVATVLNSNKGAVNTSINRANKDLAKVK